jgi:putative copper resistance protein D
VALIVDSVISWFYFIVLVFVLGVIFSKWTLFSRINQDEVFVDAFIDRILPVFAIRGLVLLLLSMLLLFLNQLTAFRDIFVPWTTDAWLLLRHTSWGSLWVATLTVYALALMALNLRGRSGWGFATVCVLLGAMFPAFSGHASAVEDLSWLSLSADVLHVWSAGGWLGSLACIIIIDLYWKRRDSEQKSLIPMFISRFSSCSMVWAPMLVISGVVSTSIHLSGVGDLFYSDYGRVLFLKIILAVTVVGLGLLNSIIVKGRSHESGDTGRLKSNISKEVWISQIVLLLTAILIQGSPPGHQDAGHHLSIEMFLVRIVGIGMFFYVIAFSLILLFAIYLLKGSKSESD